MTLQSSYSFTLVKWEYAYLQQLDLIDLVIFSNFQMRICSTYYNKLLSR